MSQAGDDRRYLRAVEAAWSNLVGRPSILSPREFETIDSWRRRGIPLSVVLEVVTASKRRSGKTPRSITALAGAIEAAWEAVAGGRTARASAAPGPAKVDAPGAWDAVRQREPDGSALGALLADLLERARAGSDPAEIDAALDRALAGAVPSDLVERTRGEIARELGSFRARMSEDQFRSSLSRALVDRLRASLGLPRLALMR